MLVKFILIHTETLYIGAVTICYLLCVLGEGGHVHLTNRPYLVHVSGKLSKGMEYKSLYRCVSEPVGNVKGACVCKYSPCIAILVSSHTVLFKSHNYGHYIVCILYRIDV